MLYWLAAGNKFKKFSAGRELSSRRQGFAKRFINLSSASLLGIVSASGASAYNFCVGQPVSGNAQWDIVDGTGSSASEADVPFMLDGGDVWTPVENIDSVSIRGLHQYVGDLAAALVSPSGTVTTLFRLGDGVFGEAGSDCSGADFDLEFRDANAGAVGNIISVNNEDDYCTGNNSNGQGPYSPPYLSNWPSSYYTVSNGVASPNNPALFGRNVPIYNNGPGSSANGASGSDNQPGASGNALSNHIGDDPLSGPWRVRTFDAYKQDIGTVLEACVDIDYASLTYDMWVSTDSPTCADKLDTLNSVAMGDTVYVCHVASNEGTENFAFYSETNANNHSVSTEFSGLYDAKYGGSGTVKTAIRSFVAGTTTMPLGLNTISESITVEGTGPQFVGGEFLTTDERVLVQVVPTPMLIKNDGISGVNSATDQAAVLNVLDNDLFDGGAIDLARVELSLAPGAIVPAALTFNSDGTVDVAAGTPSGLYQFNYQICERDPSGAVTTNCSTATVNIDVFAPIDASSDSVSGVDSSSNNTAVLNVLPNDSLNGSVPSPSDVRVTVAFGEVLPAGFSINADGSVGVAVNTPSGNYSFDYTICEFDDVGDASENCATSSVSVGVVGPIVANNDVVSGVDGVVGAPAVVDVFANNGSGIDTLNGAAANIYDVSLSLVSGATSINGGPVPSLDTALGVVDVPIRTPSGSYVIEYKICELNFPTNCSTASVTVNVAMPDISAKNDTVSNINGYEGALGIVDIFANNGNGLDMYDGEPAVAAAVSLTVLTPATSINGGPVPSLNPQTDLVDVLPETPAGTYNIVYQICDLLNPTNCSQATLTIEVVAATLVAQDDVRQNINGFVGENNALNIFENNGSGVDALNGYRTSTAESTVAVTSPATPLIAGANVPTLGADGIVDVPALTPAGNYNISYELCETLNAASGNCDQATVSLSVDPPSIVAQDDPYHLILDGIAGGPVFNVLNDNGAGVNLLNDDPADLSDVAISLVTPVSGVTVLPITGSHPMPQFNVADGEVTLPAGTPAGAYKFQYQICDTFNSHLVPLNCDPAWAYIEVPMPTINAAPENPSTLLAARPGPTVINVLGDDLFNGGIATLSNVNISPEWAGYLTAHNSASMAALSPGDIVFNEANGTIVVSNTAPGGVFEIQYEICDAVNPSNCSREYETVAILPLEIEALHDYFAPINGALGGTTSVSVLESDIVDNANAAGELGVSIQFTTPVAADITDSNGDPVSGISLDASNGYITVASEMPAGDYYVTYEICSITDASKCSSVKEHIIVLASELIATSDTVNDIDGYIGELGVVNVLSNDTIRGQNVLGLSETTMSIVAPAVSLHGGPVPVLNPNGVIDVPASTPAGPYTIEYKLCENLNPTNCSSAYATINVAAAPIVANDDQVTVADGIAEHPEVLDIFADNGNGIDTIDGVSVSHSTIVVKVLSAADTVHGGAVPTLNVATGKIDVPSETAEGTYDITYSICDILNPQNCDTATVTIEVGAAILSAENDSVLNVSGLDGGQNIINVLLDNGNGRDTLGDYNITTDDVWITLVTPAQLINGLHVPLLDLTDGTIDVPHHTAAGTYTIGYKVCEKLNPTNCDEATISIGVDAPLIVARPDSVSGVNGASGANNVMNVLDPGGVGEDTLDGDPITITDISLLVIILAEPINNAHAPVLNVQTGSVNVLPETAAGTYTIKYKICERLNPTNCASSVATIGVGLTDLVVRPDDIGPVDGSSGSGSAGNILADNGSGPDLWNGVPADIYHLDVSILQPATPIRGGEIPTIDTINGNIVVPAGTSAGTYEITYQVCEKLNPTNCEQASVSVNVAGADIVAGNDDFSAVAIDGNAGGVTADVLINDTLAGALIDLNPDAVSLSLSDDGGIVGAEIAEDGYISIPEGVTGGVYTLTYAVCEKLNPTNCATAQVQVFIEKITAVVEEPDTIDGAVGGRTQSILRSDTLNGALVDPAEVTVVVDLADPGLSLDPVTHEMVVAAGVPNGVLELIYTVCTTDQVSCSTAIEHVVIGTIGALSEPSLVISDDGGMTETSIFASDILQGAHFAANEVLSIITHADPVLLVHNDGRVSVEAGTSAGVYGLDYTICDLVQTTICSQTSERVQMDIIGSIEVIVNQEIIDNGDGIDGAGDQVIYTITVQNHTNTALSNLNLSPALVDKVGNALTLTDFPTFVSSDQGSSVGTLVAGETASYTAGYVLTEADVAAGGVSFSVVGVADPDIPSGYVGDVPPIHDISDSGNNADGGSDPTDFNILPDGYLEGLEIVKIAGNTRPQRGDIVSYTIRIINRSDTTELHADIVDMMPEGFAYVSGSATYNGDLIVPDVELGRKVSFPDLHIVPMSENVVVLSARVSSSAPAGDSINYADLIKARHGGKAAPTAQATVTISPEPVFDCGDVIGTVFDDLDSNGYQGPQEPGLPAVRVATVNGTIITTDQFGRYHVPCAELPARSGTNFIVKLDTRSLPTGYRVTTENPRVVRLTRGMSTAADFGASISRVVRVDINSRAFAVNDAGEFVLTEAFADSLGPFLSAVNTQPSILRIAYHLPTEASEAQMTTARHMMDVVESRIKRQWRIIGNYHLSIERTYVVEE